MIDALGDENDQALAHHPLSTMDPDGAYVTGLLGGALAGVGNRAVDLSASQAEAEWLATYLVLDSAGP